MLQQTAALVHNSSPGMWWQGLALVLELWVRAGAGHGQGCPRATTGVSLCPQLQPCSLASLHSARGQGWGEAKQGQAGAMQGKCRHRPYSFWSFSTKGFWGGGCFISQFFWKGFGLISSSAKH